MIDQISEELRVSIVIPVYNGEGTLDKCLDGLSRCLDGRSEVILVDNNSTDQSLELCQNFQKRYQNGKITVLTQKKRGAAAARNAGAARARGDWILFTDADCIPSSHWISDYRTHFDKDGIGAVAGCIKPHPPTNPVQMTLALFALPQNQQDIIHHSHTPTRGLYPTANLAVRKDLFGKVGGFDEGLTYGEDRELCHKIYKSGHKIKVVADSVVSHIHRNTITEMLKQSYGYGTVHPYELRSFYRGMILLTVPFFQICKEASGIYFWMDLNQADKKMFLPIFLGIFWPNLFIVALLYFFYLCLFVRLQAKKKSIETKFYELPIVSVLLILKSVALTVGRVRNSIKNRVFCF